ncbi:xylose isomerase-like protein [Phanerochaete sordida]|uniref:Xylose isomerase-like protein n=1 Tax=Phanerochaete sordida TaxID=48140 RepID=A0A9P3G0E5_9APHY|nr:xylose isomerase-like protein [Phanerochaete sordida]
MHPSHTLPIKLRAIYDAGFTHVEVGFPDLEAYAAQEWNGDYQKLDEKGGGDVDKLCQVAKKVKTLCQELGMEILVVHPFSKFEGYKDQKQKQQGLSRAESWFKVLKQLDCAMLQVGSSDDADSSGEFDVIAGDLRELADLAAIEDPPIRIAYEMWAWGVHVNTWEHTWEICKRVDRPNFGLCLDTFQICARAYAAPTSPSRMLPDAEDRLAVSLANLSKTVPASKIFYFQISDGSRNVSPGALASEAKRQGIDPLYAWSNAWRPLPYMDAAVEALRADAGSADMFALGLGEGVVQGGFGGYLPVMDVTRAVLETGWRGPWSYEVFYEESMGRGDVGVPRFWAKAAMRSHYLIIKDLGGS